ncbi:MAG: hypothetical protein AAFX98_02035 [Pseudomonadota bacterium]
MIWQLLGLGLATGGVGALYLAWRRKVRSWPLVVIGWVLVLGSIVSWSQTSGVDKGPALGIVAVVLIAMIAVIGSAMNAPVKKRRTVAPRRPSPGGQASVWHEGLSLTGSVLAIVFVGLIAAIASCTALFMVGRTAGMEHTANLTLTMFAFPMVWAGLATFIGYSSNAVSKVLVLMGLAAISTVLLVVTMQGT